MPWLIVKDEDFWIGVAIAAWAQVDDRVIIAAVLVFLIALFLFGLYLKIMEVRKR